MARGRVPREDRSQSPDRLEITPARLDLGQAKHLGDLAEAEPLESV
jgi:hypothetical protein